MSDRSHTPGHPPRGEALRQAIRWLSDHRRHDLAAVEEACRRFDLSPVDEEFLITESRRVAAEAVPRDMPGSEVIRPQEEDERLTDEGVRILESWNVPRDGRVSIARARLLPGETTRWHYLVETVERYLIVSGRGTVELGDRQPESVGPGDIVVIPAGLAQRIRCDGPDDLVFYCVCTPRFEASNYRPGKPGQ